MIFWKQCSTLRTILIKGGFLRFIYFVITSLFAVFLLSSCQDDPTSLGRDLIGSEIEIQVLDSQSASLKQHSDSYLSDSLTFGASERIILGSVEDRKSTMLMRFGVILPDSLRTSLDEGNLSILSAKTILKPIYRIGDENQLIDFTVHKITSGWGSNNFNSDSLAFLNYDPAELTDSKEITDSLIEFEVHEEIADEWLRALTGDSLASNYGMIFIPNTGVNKAYGFRGFPIVSTDDAPRLRFIVENENSKIDTLIARVLFDVHVVEGMTEPVSDDKFQMTAGIGQRGKLFFDLKEVPRNANINRAELTLTVDSASSLIGRADTDSLRVRLFSDSTNNSINTDYTLRRITYDGSIFKGDISSLVQAIMLGADNQGFSLTLGNEGESLDRYVVYGSTYQDQALRPKIKIYYNVNR